MRQGHKKKTIDDQSVVFFGYRLAATPQHAVYQYPPENNRFTRTFNPQSGFAALPTTGFRAPRTRPKRT